MPDSRWALGAVAVVLAAPAAAEGAALVPGAPCVRLVPGEKTFALGGTGFTPGAFVRVTADGTAVGSVQADPTGNFADVFFGPTLASIRRTRQTFQIAADDGRGGVAPPVAVPVTRVGVKLPDRARPRSRVRYRAFGFLTGQPVYLHIRRGARARGSYRIGTAAGPCGDVERRLRYMPLRRYSTGLYDYYFQHARRFDRAQPFVRLRISIFRTFRRVR